MNTLIPSNKTDIENAIEMFVNDPEYTKKGPSSSLSHLKAILYDWNVERNWEKENAHIYTNEDKSMFMCFTFTTRLPIHCTLRHIVVFESARGKRLGEHGIRFMQNFIRENNPMSRLRFFANIPAIPFYEKLGFTQYHGLSKTKLPFYYGDVDGNLISLPTAQERYLHIPNTSKQDELLDSLI